VESQRSKVVTEQSLTHGTKQNLTNKVEKKADEREKFDKPRK